MTPIFASATARLFSWLPLACFVALLLTMVTVNILPPDRHLAYAVVEWVEMAVGTISAVATFVVLFLWPRAASSAVSGWSRYRWLGVCGLGLWCIFWLVALLSHTWVD